MFGSLTNQDDPEIDRMFKERVRWDDPMAHLVKKKYPEPVLSDLGDDDKMKESGLIVPQDIPSHSRLKRGLDAAPNHVMSHEQLKPHTSRCGIIKSYNSGEERGGPTNVLVVRGLDENADEEMLRYEFYKHAPIKYDSVGWVPKEYNPDNKRPTGGQEPSGGEVAGPKDASSLQSGFVCDEASGYYYDASSGFYYDGNTGKCCKCCIMWAIAPMPQYLV
ncbi:unnamed protein product [Camellia sinensis]